MLARRPRHAAAAATAAATCVATLFAASLAPVAGAATLIHAGRVIDGVSDRALRDGLRLDGEVEAVLLVENLGAWRDMPRPGRWLLAHVPGWNTALVRPLIGAIGDVPVVHFGDLDPNGVRIVEHLRGQLPGLRWLVPDWWEELRPLHAHRREWPADLDLSGAPPLVRRLAATGEWLEQERVALDPRLPEAMAAALRGSPGG